MAIQIPYNYIPRDYQLPIWEALDDGIKRLFLVLPRRSGKTKTAVNIAARSAIVNLGAHYHYFPEYKQGKRIVWDGRDKSGFPFLDHFPRDFVYARNNQEMILTMQNMRNRKMPGSVYNVIGSDKADRSVGGNPILCIFDEYSLSNPLIWDMMRPVLAENGGVAVFILTPRGKNHAYRLWKYAQSSPDWFEMRLTVDDTGHIDKHVLEQEREEIIRAHGDDALFMQEYYCSFDTPQQGSVYGALLQQLESSGRIGSCPYDPALPVHTSWDLGFNDKTAIWFIQMDPFGEPRAIDYYENDHEMMPHYGYVLQKKQQESHWFYGNHYLPHDAEAKDMKSGGNTHVKQLQPFVAPDSIKVVPRVKLISLRHDMVRQILHKARFDQKKCEKGLDAMYAYAYEYDEKRGDFKKEPNHNWASHAADAYGQFVQYYKRNNGQSRVINYSVSDDSYD